MKIKKSLVITLLLSFSFLVRAQAYDMGKVDIHGFISQGYFKTEENNFFEDSMDGTFQFNEMGINFGTKLTPKLHLGIQFFARDLSAIGNDEIVVDWAYADYRWKSWMGLSVGRIKAPMGLYNEYRDMDMLRTGVLLPQAVYYDILRDSVLGINGVCVYGKIDMRVAGTLNYQFQAGGINIAGDSGTAHGIEGLGYPGVSNIEVSNPWAGGLKWTTPVRGLLLGVSQNHAELDIYSEIMPLVLNFEPFEATVYSIEFTWENLVIAAEMNRMKIDAFLDGSPYEKMKLMGRYMSATYRITEWFEAMITYSEFFDDEDDMDGKERIKAGEERWQAWQKDWTLSLGFDINENWLFKLEEHIVNGTSQALGIYQHDELEENWSMFAAKVTFSF